MNLLLCLGHLGASSSDPGRLHLSRDFTSSGVQLGRKKRRSHHPFHLTKVALRLSHKGTPFMPRPFGHFLGSSMQLPPVVGFAAPADRPSPDPRGKSHPIPPLLRVAMCHIAHRSAAGKNASFNLLPAIHLLAERSPNWYGSAFDVIPSNEARDVHAHRVWYRCSAPTGVGACVCSMERMFGL